MLRLLSANASTSLPLRSKRCTESATSPLVAPPLMRFWAFVLAGACLTVLILAAGLHPSPNGVGSHRDLGLASCGMLDRTGIPCPGCGMTTSFTWFVRGNLLASLYVQPMGMLLALMTSLCVWGGFYVAATGRPLYRILLLLPTRTWLIGLTSFGIAAWAWKILLQLEGWDGW